MTFCPIDRYLLGQYNSTVSVFRRKPVTLFLKEDKENSETDSNTNSNGSYTKEDDPLDDWSSFPMWRKENETERHSSRSD